MSGLGKSALLFLGGLLFGTAGVLAGQYTATENE